MVKKEEKNSKAPAPKVSVIVSTYNRSALLQECIDSVLASKFGDFEFLVIDDGSTDDTKETVLSYEDQRIRYVYKENGGTSSGKNLAIKRSRGSYIAFIDDDDLWTEDRLSHVHILDENPDIDIVCCNNVFTDKDGLVKAKSEREVKYYKGSVLKPMFLCKLNPFLVNTMILRKECFEKAGLFDESIKCAVDTDIERRLAIHCNFLILGGNYYKTRVHDGERLSVRSFDEDMTELLEITGKFKPGGKHSISPWLLRRSFSRVYFLGGKKCMRDEGDLDRAMEYFRKSILYDPFNFSSYRYYFSKRRCLSLYERSLSRDSVEG